MEDNKDMEQKPKKRGRKPKVENKVEDIDKLVEMDLEDMEKTINELPLEYKRNLRDEISKKIENSEIRDYVVVQTLKRIYEI